MRRPIQDGFQSLIGTEAEVVSERALAHSARYLVRAKGEGELWSAYSSYALDIGEWVNIVAVKGVGGVVERAEPGSRLSKIGSEDDRRHCH